MTTGKRIIQESDTYQNQADEKSFIPITLHKNNGQMSQKLVPENRDSKRLQELSIKNHTYFGTTNFNIQLDLKFDYTTCGFFPEMSLSELETLHQLCELDRTKILQSLVLAVLKMPYAGNLFSKNCCNFNDYEGNLPWYYSCHLHKFHLYLFLQPNAVTSKFQFFF